MNSGSLAFKATGTQTGRSDQKVLFCLILVVFFTKVCYRQFIKTPNNHVKLWENGHTLTPLNRYGTFMF